MKKSIIHSKYIPNVEGNYRWIPKDNSDVKEIVRFAVDLNGLIRHLEIKSDLDAIKGVFLPGKIDTFLEVLQSQKFNNLPIFDAKHFQSSEFLRVYLILSNSDKAKLDGFFVGLSSRYSNQPELQAIERDFFIGLDEAINLELQNRNDQRPISVIHMKNLQGSIQEFRNR